MDNEPKRPFAIEGPCLGENDFFSPKTLPPNHLRSSNNMASRAGRLCPRPGFIEADDIDFSESSFKAVLHVNGNNAAGDLIRVVTVSSVKYTYMVRSTAGLSRDAGDAVNGFAAVKSGATRHFPAFNVAGPNTYMYIPSSTKIVDYDRVTAGGSETDMVTGVTTCGGIDYYNSQIYYGQGTALKRADVGGLNVNVTTLVSTGSTISGVAVDATNLKVLFGVNSSTPVVDRCNLNGSSLENFLIGFTASQSVKDVAVVPSEDAVFVACGSPGEIRRYKISDASLVKTYSFSSAILSITYDAAENRLLYLEDGTGEIRAIRAFFENLRVIESMPIKRTNSDISSGVLTNDIIVFQAVDVDSGKSDYGMHFINDGVAVLMTNGFSSGGNATIPNMLVSNVRSYAAPADFAFGSHYQSTSHRATMRWAGSTLQDLRGGILLANGAGGHLWSYAKPFVCDTLYSLVLGTPTAGTFTITYSGQTTAGIAFDADAAAVRAALEALSNVEEGDFYVIGGPRGPYSILAIGQFAGTDITLTFSGAGLTSGSLIENKQRTGGSFSAGLATLLKGGMPAPKTVGIASTSIGGGPIASGDYSYKIHGYSSILGIEGPGLQTDIGTVAGVNVQLTWTWDYTLLMQHGLLITSGPVPGGPLLDRVRIYRRRHNTGQTDDWYFFAEAPAYNTASPLGGSSLIDNGYTTTDDRTPIMNFYPPENANFVELVKDKAIWASSDVGDRDIWISEEPKVGGIGDGELGFLYVRSSANETMIPYVASDAPLSGLAEHRGNLLISTEDTFIVGIIAAPSESRKSAFERVNGIPGFASNWLKATRETLPNARRSIVWMAKSGLVYEWDGAEASCISRNLPAKALSFVKATTRRDDLTLTYLNSLYYASAAAEPTEGRIIFAVPTFDVAGGHPIACMVLDTDFGGWYTWSISARTFALLREWDATKGQPGESRLLFWRDAGTRLCKFLDGYGDAGVPFAYSARWGELGLQAPNFEKRIYDARLDFELRSFGGIAAQVAASIFFDGEERAQAAESPDTRGFIRLSPQLRGHRISLAISGTQADQQSHAELVGFYGMHTMPGKDRP